MNEQVLILAAALTLTCAAFSRLAENSIVTPTMLFMLIGLPISMLLGAGIATGIQTIMLSVLLHGVTAAPVAARYGRSMSAQGAG